MEKQKDSLGAVGREAAHAAALRKTLAAFEAENREFTAALERQKGSLKALGEEAAHAPALRKTLAAFEAENRELTAEVKHQQEWRGVLTEQLENMQTKLMDTEEELATKCSELEAQASANNVERRGRKKGHDGRAKLEERWDTMGTEARYKALFRHADDIAVHLMAAGCIDWLPAAMVLAFKKLD
eukprot:6178207-Pleurochrysis_carterae.AAC.1